MLVHISERPDGLTIGFEQEGFENGMRKAKEIFSEWKDINEALYRDLCEGTHFRIATAGKFVPEAAEPPLDMSKADLYQRRQKKKMAGISQTRDATRPPAGHGKRPYR